MNDKLYQEFVFYAKKTLSEISKLSSLYKRYTNASCKDAQPEYYDSAQIKKMLHIGESKLQKMRKEKLIPFIKVGNRYLYPKKDIDEMFNL